MSAAKYQAGSDIMAATGDPKLLSDEELSALLSKVMEIRRTKPLSLVQDLAFRWAIWQLARERGRRAS